MREYKKDKLIWYILISFGIKFKNLKISGMVYRHIPAHFEHCTASMFSNNTSTLSTLRVVCVSELGKLRPDVPSLAYLRGLLNTASDLYMVRGRTDRAGNLCSCYLIKTQGLVL
jgi:hypothetical protein